MGINQQCETAKKLVAREKKLAEYHEAELQKIDEEKQFMVRDKVAELLALMKELGYRELVDHRDNELLNVIETNIGELRAKK